MGCPIFSVAELCGCREKQSEMAALPHRQNSITKEAASGVRTVSDGSGDSKSRSPIVPTWRMGVRIGLKIRGVTAAGLPRGRVSKPKQGMRPIDPQNGGKAALHALFSHESQ